MSSSLEQYLKKVLSTNERDDLAADYGQIEGWDKRVPFVDGFDARQKDVECLAKMVRQLYELWSVYEKAKFGNSIVVHQINKLAADRLKEML